MSAAESSRGLPARAPARILVAEDDDGVRAGLVANLEIEGYEIVEARDGGQAIALLEQQTFDLIISDVVMPIATGVDVLSAVRKRQIEAPFILISAFVSEELVTRALSEGLFAMLYKPFAMERILAVVARALQQRAVLLVDDTHSFVSSLAEALRSVGMRVEACVDGKSAVDYARKNGVDVCVLDLVMEPLDGLKTCEALQAVDAHMDIIAITGLASNEQVRGITRRGIATCLRKPFDVQDLLTAIARVRAAAPVKK